MTRDEAKNIAQACCGDRVAASRFVELASALGMLKLDEPKSVNQIARAQFKRENLDGNLGEIFMGAMERAGLKIVER